MELICLALPLLLCYFSPSPFVLLPPHDKPSSYPMSMTPPALLADATREASMHRLNPAAYAGDDDGAMALRMFAAFRYFCLPTYMQRVSGLRSRDDFFTVIGFCFLLQVHL